MERYIFNDKDSTKKKFLSIINHRMLKLKKPMVEMAIVFDEIDKLQPGEQATWVIELQLQYYSDSCEITLKLPNHFNSLELIQTQQQEMNLCQKTYGIKRAYHTKDGEPTL